MTRDDKSNIGYGIGFAVILFVLGWLFKDIVAGVGLVIVYGVIGLAQSGFGR